MWGLVAPRCVESSWIRDQPRVPCFGKWILIHWTTRDVQMSSFSKALCPDRWGCSWVGKAERKGNVRVPLTTLWWASLVAQIINNLPANAEDLGSIPGSGRSPGEGNANPLLYSCLGNPMHREAWWATVHGVAKTQTRLKWLNSSSSNCSLITVYLKHDFSKCHKWFISKISSSELRPNSMRCSSNKFNKWRTLWLMCQKA